MTGERVAVVLAGCGHRDGAEVREAVFTLLALDRAGATFQCFAPDKDQYDVVNHITGEVVSGETRNVLLESARIARGDIEPLNEFRAEDFEAIIFPGGFGGAKNFSDFAVAGAKATVDPHVRAAVESMQAAGKPIGFICITPAAVGAAVLGKQGVALTVGRDDDPAAQGLRDLGATHVQCAVGNAVVDKEHLVVSTPAYMDGKARPSEVYAGIDELVQSVLQLVQPTAVSR